MATPAQGIICGGFFFYNNFDSANLAKVEAIKVPEPADREVCDNGSKSAKIVDDTPNYEFNVWTKHDCHGTEFQNNNRTWFYFGIKSPSQGVCVKLNVVNLNRQSKMFSEGMCPVFKVIPGHLHWERIRDKPTYTMDQKGSEFTLSFTFRTPENPKAVIYVAFTYPFTYSDLQYYLNKIDVKMAKQELLSADTIYYHRECAIKSLEERRLDVLTISSYHNITTEPEERLKGLFPETSEERPMKFRGKRIVFVSARVHPGETPSSFVFNGFLNFLLNREDPIAVILRQIYVFKLIPMLNPDGVARGHYRMDTRGVNLNRVYLNPSIEDHPTIFAARSLIRYYHNWYEIHNEVEVIPKDAIHMNLEVNKDETNVITRDKKDKCTDELNAGSGSSNKETVLITSHSNNGRFTEALDKTPERNDNATRKNTATSISVGSMPRSSEDSGLFLYVDLHGHASKKGIFMYGNYFDNLDDTIMCMLLPKLMSINNPNFHFTSCNFAERNMYLIDKRDGMSREGSGRVAVYKMTGLVRSYTLECNYNSGRLVNTIPSRVRDNVIKPQGHMFMPPKYTPTVFEEVGAALGPSILDLTNSNPNSRLPNSQYRSLRGVKSFLKMTYANSLAGIINQPRLKPLASHNIAMKESTCLKDVVAINATSEESSSNNKDENSALKSRTVRRTSSLYSAVKRIKSGKRNARQLAENRKSLTNQRRLNNVENGSMVSKIRSTRRGVKPGILKPVGHRLLMDTNLQKIVGKHPRKKNTVGLIAGQAAIIQKGIKRFKLIRKGLKTKPEVGESSCTLATDNSSKGKVHFGIDKRVKKTISRLRKSEQTKQRNKLSSNINTKI